MLSKSDVEISKSDVEINKDKFVANLTQMAETFQKTFGFQLYLKFFMPDTEVEEDYKLQRYEDTNQYLCTNKYGNTHIFYDEKGKLSQIKFYSRDSSYLGKIDFTPKEILITTVTLKEVQPEEAKQVGVTLEELKAEKYINTFKPVINFFQVIEKKLTSSLKEFDSQYTPPQSSKLNLEAFTTSDSKFPQQIINPLRTTKQAPPPYLRHLS